MRCRHHTARARAVFWHEPETPESIKLVQLCRLVGPQNSIPSVSHGTSIKINQASFLNSSASLSFTLSHSLWLHFFCHKHLQMINVADWGTSSNAATPNHSLIWIAVCSLAWFAGLYHLTERSMRCAPVQITLKQSN
jgi:hypothetical protein